MMQHRFSTKILQNVKIYFTFMLTDCKNIGIMQLDKTTKGSNVYFHFVKQIRKEPEGGNGRMSEVVLKGLKKVYDKTKLLQYMM